MGELTTNKAIEDAAIKWVVEQERAAGRLAEDTRFQRSAGDIESPPRVIEVKAKGRSHRGEDIWLEPRQAEEAERNPDFFVYVVENVRQGDPAFFTLRVLGGTDLVDCSNVRGNSATSLCPGLWPSTIRFHSDSADRYVRW